MARVIITATADADVDRIFSSLAKRAGGRTAEKYLRLFDEAYQRLAANPGSGFARKRLGTNTRMVIAAPYLVIYDWDAAGDTVVVLRVLYEGRKITRRLLRSEKP
jgi:plasmid stabilization system protein ParE